MLEDCKQLTQACMSPQDFVIWMAHDYDYWELQPEGILNSGVALHVERFPGGKEHSHCLLSWLLDLLIILTNFFFCVT